MTDTDLDEMAEMSVNDEPDAPTFEDTNEVIAAGTPALAESFLRATEEFIETLQRVTVAEGKDDADDYIRAYNAIDNMRSLACNVRRKYGFTPRREPDSEPDAIALHEAAHSVVARKLGIEVMRASAAAENPGVRTRFRDSQIADDAVVALAGLAVDYSSEACAGGFAERDRKH
jgi:hypothetical protein